MSSDCSVCVYMFSADGGVRAQEARTLHGVGDPGWSLECCGVPGGGGGRCRVSTYAEVREGLGGRTSALPETTWSALVWDHLPIRS